MLSLFLRISPKFLNKFTYKCFHNLLFHWVKMRKKVVLQNLERAFPNKSEEWYHNMASNCYKFAIKDFLDFISFPKYFKHKELNFHNLDILDNALKKNKGAIFVSGHFGNFEKMFYGLGNKGYDICGVAKKQKRGDQFFREIEEQYVDYSKLMKIFPEFAPRSIQDGLDPTIEWYKGHYRNMPVPS